MEGIALLLKRHQTHSGIVAIIRETLGPAWLTQAEVWVSQRLDRMTVGRRIDLVARCNECILAFEAKTTWQQVYSELLNPSKYKPAVELATRFYFALPAEELPRCHLSALPHYTGLIVVTPDHTMKIIAEPFPMPVGMA